MAKGGVKTSERAAFIEWWFTVGRDPKTQTEWAKENGVHFVTLSEWKRSPEFAAALNNYRAILRPEFIAATRVMLSLAQKGDVAAYQAVIKVIGEAAPDRVTISVDRVSYVEPASLAKLAADRFPELVN